MAVNFHDRLGVLVDDLRRRGLKPEVVSQSGKGRILAAEIAVQGGVVIHWDRESRSLWTEGPWPQAARLEKRLDRLYHGNSVERAAKRPKFLIGALAVGLLLAAGYLAVNNSKKFRQDPIVKPTEEFEAPVATATPAAESPAPPPQAN